MAKFKRDNKIEKVKATQILTSAEERMEFSKVERKIKIELYKCIQIKDIDTFKQGVRKRYKLNENNEEFLDNIGMVFQLKFLENRNEEDLKNELAEFFLNHPEYISKNNLEIGRALRKVLAKTIEKLKSIREL